MIRVARNLRRRRGIATPHDPGHAPRTTMKIISWNLLRLSGATVDDVAALIGREQPDVLLMQEATHMIDTLAEHAGGHYWRTLQPGRVHGLAIWTRSKPASPPRIVPLPASAMFRRIGLVADLGPFSVANVHLSHGQMLNRRQLRRMADALPEHAAILGDYNLVGPPLLPGFRDVGPRFATHIAGEFVPLRIDRCLARGLTCTGAHVLPRATSDHRPIVVRLAVAQKYAAA